MILCRTSCSLYDKCEFSNLMQRCIFDFGIPPSREDDEDDDFFYRNTM